MSLPTKVNIVVSTNNGGTVTTSTITINIPKNLTDGTQPGISGPDQVLRNIHKAGGFWDSNNITWYSRGVIQSATYS